MEKIPMDRYTPCFRFDSWSIDGDCLHWNECFHEGQVKPHRDKFVRAVEEIVSSCGDIVMQQEDNCHVFLDYKPGRGVRVRGISLSWGTQPYVPEASGCFTFRDICLTVPQVKKLVRWQIGKCHRRNKALEKAGLWWD